MEEAKTSPLVANFVCANGDGFKNETEKAAMLGGSLLHHLEHSVDLSIDSWSNKQHLTNGKSINKLPHLPHPHPHPQRNAMSRSEMLRCEVARMRRREDARCQAPAKADKMS
ncbi:GD14541 [Drosophila simulans]|uniref:GD14541 n=1 Tax=Drosophila simulans TaxID=7240 RepID=B4QL12_DROSI|nr:GD14541 [Drosophila simulans]